MSLSFERQDSLRLNQQGTSVSILAAGGLSCCMEEDCSRETSAGTAHSPAKPQQQRPPLFQTASQDNSRLQRSCRQAPQEVVRQETLRKEEEARRVAALRQTKLKEKNKRWAACEPHDQRTCSCYINYIWQQLCCSTLSS